MEDLLFLFPLVCPSLFPLLPPAPIFFLAHVFYVFFFASLDLLHPGSRKILTRPCNHTLPTTAEDECRAMGTTIQPQILFLDAYDSFTNNICSLLTTLLDADVWLLNIDDPILHEAPESLYEELAHYDAVVCGPGPGHPANPDHVGLIRRLWHIPEQALIPAIGICLGFQSLVTEFGCSVERLRRGLHGRIWEINPSRWTGDGALGRDIFSGTEAFKATLYHSLGVVGPSDVQVNSQLCPLAFTTGEEGESILMAVRHAVKPFWGLQYHPESICTDRSAHEVLRSWFDAAMAWNKDRGRRITTIRSRRARAATRRSLLGSATRSATSCAPNRPEKVQTSLSRRTPFSLRGLAKNFAYSSAAVSLPAGATVPGLMESLTTNSHDAILLDSSNCDATDNKVRGRYSIIALDVDEALRIEYQAGLPNATISMPPRLVRHFGSVSEEVDLTPYQGSIWKLIANFHKARCLPLVGLEHVPFAGGFMGYISYEMGLEDIGVALPKGKERGHNRPDICLAWITRSIVVDHNYKKAHIQCLDQDDTSRWLNHIKLVIRNAPKDSARTNDISGSKNAGFASIKTPNPTEYEAKVRACQEYIAAGDSYELCLTDQTTITRLLPAKMGGELGSAEDMCWDLFKALRTAQPAPFSAYIRLGFTTLVAGSPERFLKYRPRYKKASIRVPQGHNGSTYTVNGSQNSKKHDTFPEPSPAGKISTGRGNSCCEVDWVCTMRPMKGTVRKGPCPSHPLGIKTIAEAEKILHTEKEMAENLMIVDLVRHDLHGVCGAGRVSVPRLMEVEEYESVWQMVTVIEGILPSPPQSPGDKCDDDVDVEYADADADADTYTGLDVLAASLPPGSMTGAPKRRSCEILREVEGGEERGLYSGVFGYMDIAGRGDWSVTIRSLFRYDDEVVVGKDGKDGEEIWHVGAGGAITILSTAEGEREEMFTKLRGPLEVVERAWRGSLV